MKYLPLYLKCAGLKSLRGGYELLPSAGERFLAVVKKVTSFYMYRRLTSPRHHVPRRCPGILTWGAFLSGRVSFRRRHASSTDVLSLNSRGNRPALEM